MTLIVDDRLDDGTNGQTFAARGALGIQGTAPTYVAPAYLGGAGLSFNTSASPILSIAEATTASSTTKYVDVFFKSSATISATGVVLSCRGTSDVARVVFTSGNVMRLTNGAGTTLQTGAVALPIGAWFRVQLSVVANVGTALLFTDPTSNTPAETLTGAVTGAAMTLNRFGNINGLNLNGGTLQADWPQVSNDAAPVARDTALTASAVLSPTSLTPPNTLTLTITAAGGSGSYTYAVTNWGDASTTGSQSSNVFTKSILSGAAAGAKTVSWTVTG